MIQEEKELLLKDLCGRLPYGVKVLYGNHVKELQYIEAVYDEVKLLDYTMNYTVGIEEIKPYLFPLSSMTEDQKNEYYSIVNYISSDDTENWKEGEFIYVDQFSCLIHFYHRNHLDYLGLIPKGLAINATGKNIYK